MTKSFTRMLGLVAMIGMGTSSADAQLLLQDNFDTPGIVNPQVWRLPFGSEGTFVGRTQYAGDPATDMPLQGIAEPSATDGFVAEINLDTFSPIDPGNQFLGTDLLSKRNFARGGGVSFESRLRLKPGATTPGLVGGFFTFDVATRTTPDPVRDEIDFELISNQVGGTEDPATNFWNEGPFTGPGAGGDLQFHDVAGFDLTQFNDYRVEWTPNSVTWFVNNTQVRQQTTDVPDDPMKLHFNLWAPDSDFTDAFNAALQPEALQANNTTYTLQVDSVEVNRFDTAETELITDGSFEDINLQILGFTDASVASPTLTGEWVKFGNVFLEQEDTAGVSVTPDVAPDGDFMVKMFGPFTGGPDASGVFQNVPATPGQEFEASAVALTPTGDSISGNANFNTVAISFLDAAGTPIEVAPFVPTNGRDFPLLDGRDPNLTQDAFVSGTANAIAPAGTAFARISLFFVQENNEGGASWFDSASLKLLEATAPPLVPGDFDGDGFVGLSDLNILGANFNTMGGATLATGDANGDGNVDLADLNILGANWNPAPAVSVPEPASIVLLGVAAVCVLPRRRA